MGIWAGPGNEAVMYHTCPGVQDPEDQRMCLELGKEAGLDVAAITKEVVENIRNTGMVSTWALLNPRT